MDFVGDWFVVDGVERLRVLDFEGSVDVPVLVETAGFFDDGFVDGVTYAVGVEVGAGHWVSFVVDDAVEGSVEHGVDAEGEDVLVVGGENAWVNNGTPWDGDSFVDGLGGENTGCTGFVG